MGLTKSCRVTFNNRCWFRAWARKWASGGSVPRIIPAMKPSRTSFADALGRGQALKITFSGLPNQPDLVCLLHLYDDEPYGDVSVAVRNGTGHSITVQAIRVLDAAGNPPVDLGASDQDDRVLAETVSEDPTIHIGSLSQAPHGIYVGVGSNLIYNRTSKQSLLLSALTSDRFLTIGRLRVRQDASGAAHIASLTVDSTGTTEAILDRDPISRDQQVQLSLLVAPGTSLSSERVMFSAGPGYLQELEAYGEAVHRLHPFRFSPEAPRGWWSWTAFYAGINEGEVLANAQWLAQHLKSLGYDYFHIDEGYDYARGEFTTANATQFPHGMLSLEHKISSLGLVPALWTAPFEVSERSWVYQHHKDWLVRDTQGRPIFIGYVNKRADRLYVLDTTNPGAQAYLRQTYRILAREWGIRSFKLDFMDYTLVEGTYYRPHTTALEAQRIGLKIIRETVGPDVLLNKDGSVMLNAVGFVDDGRIAPDAGHSFEASKDADPNIAARFYMNRNFYISDPDAFSVSTEVEPDETWHEMKRPLSLDEAEVQIVLAAVAGGMFEIGDDLPTLAATPDRLALVENQDLLRMVRLGRAALPMDLMSFSNEDQMPSEYFLQEDTRQSMVAVFNWTEEPHTHTLELKSLGLPPGHPYEAYDVLNGDKPAAIEAGSLVVGPQPPHSVRLIKIVDTSVPASAPAVSLDVPKAAQPGEAVNFRAKSAAVGAPALSYHWDFGDDTTATGPEVAHTYTRAATFNAKLTVEGMDGIAAEKDFAVDVQGELKTVFHLPENRRFVEPGAN